MAASLDDEVILMSTQGNRYFSLNSVGRYVWELLDEPQTMSNLVDGIRNRFKVDRTTARQDVEEFLEVLKARNLVSVQ